MSKMKTPAGLAVWRGLHSLKGTKAVSSHGIKKKGKPTNTG
jgi:hypothetical protein